MKVPVVPVIAFYKEKGVVAQLLPPLPDFPSGAEEEDTKRVNALIGEWVEKRPENYYWLHRRFKTTVDGSKSVY